MPFTPRFLFLSFPCIVWHREQERDPLKVNNLTFSVRRLDVVLFFSREDLCYFFIVFHFLTEKNGRAILLLSSRFTLTLRETNTQRGNQGKKWSGKIFLVFLSRRGRWRAAVQSVLVSWSKPLGWESQERWRASCLLLRKNEERQEFVCLKECPHLSKQED